MSKPNLNKMTIIDIINKIGVFITPEQLQSIVKYRAEFLHSMEDSNVNMKNINVENFLINNSNNINKEKLVYFTTTSLLTQMKDLELKLHQNRNSLDIMYFETLQGNLKNCKELLENAKFEIPILRQDDNGIYVIDKIKTSDELLHNKVKKDDLLKEKNLNRLHEIENDLELKAFISIGSLDDFEEFTALYKPNGSDFKFVILHNTTRKVDQFVEENVLKNNIPSANEINEYKFSEFMSEINKIIYQFPEKIDIDKFLLVSAYRAKKLIEINDNKNEKYFLTEIMKVASRHIEDKKSKISGLIRIEDDKYSRKIEYSAKKLNDDMSKIANGIYFPDDVISQTKKSILTGEIEIGNNVAVSEELIKLLKLSGKEKRELINLKSENFQYLVMLNALSVDEVKDIINEGKEEIKLDALFTDFMYHNKMIDKNDMIQLYMKNNINFHNFINLNELTEIKYQITVEELMQYYFEMKENNNDAKKFYRYSLIFRELKLKDKTTEEIDFISNQMMEELYKRDSEYDEDLKALYKESLLPIRTLIDWNGDEMIYDLMRENLLKQHDAKTLLLNGKLDITKISNILNESDLSDGEKVNFIFGSFNGSGKNEEENKILANARIELMQSLNGRIGQVVEKAQTHGTRVKGNGTSSYNKYIVDPQLRWQFLSSLDETCDSSRMYSRTTSVFILPNVNNGIVIIEKLFKNTSDGTIYNYGDATFVMKSEDFYDNEEEIIQNHKVVKGVLTDMTEEGKAKRIVHGPSWGKNIAEYANVSLENGYSQDKIEQIDELIERIRVERDLIK